MVVVKVSPLKSASFSMSSPRSPVTERACLTFRLVSLWKRERQWIDERRGRKTWETQRKVRGENGTEEEEKGIRKIWWEAETDDEQEEQGSEEKLEIFYKIAYTCWCFICVWNEFSLWLNTRLTNPSSSAVSMYTRLRGSLLESNRRSAWNHRRIYHQNLLYQNETIRFLIHHIKTILYAEDIVPNMMVASTTQTNAGISSVHSWSVTAYPL